MVSISTVASGCISICETRSLISLRHGFVTVLLVTQVRSFPLEKG